MALNGCDTKPGRNRREDSLARVLLTTAIVAALYIPLPHLASAEQTATEAVRGTVREVLYVLCELRDASRTAQRQWEVEQIVRRSFNYEAMAQRSLGEAWEGLSAPQRRQYVRLFVQLLRDDVTDRLRDYSADRVAYLSEEEGDAVREVTTAPAGVEVDTRIEFQVVWRSGSWLMDDMVVDGASLVGRYQAQFSRILRDGSFAELMERMQQRDLVA